MASPWFSGPLPSLAIFGPQSKTPSDRYLSELRSYIRSKAVLVPLVQAIKDLPRVWAAFRPLHPGFATLEDGPICLQNLSDWISSDEEGIAEAEFKGTVGGMLAAVSVACARDEEEIVAHACKIIRIAVGIGAAGDVGDDNPSKMSTIMVIRLKHAGQAEEIVKSFPGVRMEDVHIRSPPLSLPNTIENDTHISAITDARTVSIVGPARCLLELQQFAVAQKLTVQLIPLRGKLHHPDNLQLVEELSKFCDADEQLRIPHAACALVPFRSNRTTKISTEGSFSLEIARTILVDKCEWYQLLSEVAMDLSRTGRTTHFLAAFGIGDCVSLKPFRDAGVQISKMDMFTLLGMSPTRAPELEPSPGIPTDQSSRAIAVVGLAGRFPGANSVEELWEVISSGKSMVQEVPTERINFQDSFRVQSDCKWASKQKFYGNFITDHDCFDYSFFRVSSKEATYMDPQQCLLLETAYQAMESSGYICSTQRRDAGDRVGVFLGASFIDYLEHTSAHAPNAYTATGTITAFLSGKVSHYFGWTGPSEVIDTACSASLVAISRACRALQRGECTTALAGGVNFLGTATHFLDLGRAGFLSQTGQCKPFDAAADGYCRSEGVGLLVLKPLVEAMANHDKIFAVIPGIATNQGSDPKSITVPHTASQLQLYKDILQEANMSPSLVTYVETHGTGTQVGDPVEIEGIRRGFASPTREHALYVGSIKANIGHCECAAGVAGVIKAILMINKGLIPPMANFQRLNPKIPSIEPAKMVIPTATQPWRAPFRAICVNSYGAAGSNAALLLCQSPQQDKPDAAPYPRLPSPYPIILTAASRNSLSANARSLKKYLAGSAPKIGDVALTLFQCRKPQRFAWTCTAEDISTLSGSLDALEKVTEVPQTPKKLVLAFSGQAKQAVGLHKGLYESCPLLQQHLDRCDHYLVRSGSPSLYPWIFQTKPHCDVVLLQCSLFALQYACATAWIESGLKVDAVVGHSFGELTAMAVAGVMSLEDAMDLVRTRAQLIQSKWGPEQGTMVVIHGTEAVIHDIIARLPDGSGEVEIACYNAPTSHVIVGSADAIAAIENILLQEPSFRGIASSKVDTTHGFHSRFSESLLGDLDEAAERCHFSSPQIPVESSTRDPVSHISFQRISQHMRRPVFFYHAVHRLEQHLGSCIWLEAGVDSPIIPMIKKAVLAPQEHVFLPIKLGTRQNPMDAVSEATAQLWREGVPVSFFNFKTAGVKPIWLPPYSFERTKAWLAYVDPIQDALRTRTLKAPEPRTESKGVSLKLVRPLTDAQQDPHTLCFGVGTLTERFRSIVTGHNVIGHPLCPAALYIEFVIMAATSVLDSGDRPGFSLWDFRIDAPLGIDTRRAVNLTIRGKHSPDWTFTVESSAIGNLKSKSTVHAKASFRLFAALDDHQARQFQYQQRVVKARLSNFMAIAPPTETFRTRRAYKLFSRVVNYSSILQGISVVVMAGTEVMAELALPAASDTEESTAVSACDTIALDNYVQVLGLLVNTSDLCADDEAYLATGADSIVVHPGCDFKAMRKGRVYASFCAVGDAKATGDIFVLDNDEALVVTITGMHFSKLPLSTLHKILGPVTQDDTISRSRLNQQFSACPAIHLPTPSTTAPKVLNEGPSTSSTQNGIDEASIVALKKVMAEFIGLSPGEISINAAIADLGVDSLAAIELVDELRSRFHVEIGSNEVLATNIEGIVRLLPKMQSWTPDLDKTLSGTNPSRSASTGIVSSFLSPAFNQTSINSGRQEHILTLIAEYAAIDVQSITPDATFEALGVDSLSLIELISSVQEAFGVELDFDLSTTVTALVSLLNQTSDRNMLQPMRPPLADATQVASNPNFETSALKDAVYKVLAEYAAVDMSSIVKTASLDAIGFDSLSLIELKSALEIYGSELELDLSTTVETLLSTVGAASNAVYEPLTPSSSPPNRSPTSLEPPAISFSQKDECLGNTGLDNNSSPSRDPLEALNDCQSLFTAAADRHGLTGYWETVVLQQDELTVAYITEAFEQLGIRLRDLREGETVPELDCSPKHSRLVSRLWDILTEYGIVKRRGSQITRSTKPLPSLLPEALLDRLTTSHPKYTTDAQLISVTAPHLARCLTEQEDAVRLLFGTPTGKDVLNKFYSDSPLFKPSTNLLLDLMDRVIPRGNLQAPFRILEVGAGTGGTTKQLCELLQSRNKAVQYTFTDISPTLVNVAKRKFSQQYPWMDFCTLDLEKDPQPPCKRNGFVVLLELTRNINWFDLVFGLLSGWWSAKDGRNYPLQPPHAWVSYLQEAGFGSCGWTTGSTKESTTQQIIIGSTRLHKIGTKNETQRYELRTVPYKVVDDLPIEADIYYPPPQDRSRNKPMPIALMLHGGGYMTLSRRAIRPHQTQYLLTNNLLPISLDYRLCPEVDVHSGPITDICDALVWARTTLPGIAKEQGVLVDVDKLVVVGWSTGGHLAITTGWTCFEKGVKPPTAILSFYAPTDFEHEYWTLRDLGAYPAPTMDVESIERALSGKVISHYDGPKGIGASEENLGLLCRGDPRSELILNLFAGGNGLSLLLNGFTGSLNRLLLPTTIQIQSLSPLAHVRDGSYRTPTYIIHGEKDEVVPCQMSVTFIKEMKARGLDGEVQVVPRRRHIFDLTLKPGDAQWKKWIEPGYQFLFEHLLVEGTGDNNTR
ncbi:hypothetical protein N7485_005289 [Penicillium canescens]|nr:hypothetical protein N7485_005289 [Penicillium canescens]